MFLVLGFCAVSCSDDEDYNPKEETFLSKFFKEGMIKLEENIGEWDAAVIYAEDGYLLYKEEKIDDSKTVDYYQIESPDSGYNCAIFANRTTSIPEVLLIGEERYDFVDNGEGLMHILRSDAEGSEVIDSLHYVLNDGGSSSRAFTFTTIEYINRDDKVKRVVKALDAILEAGDSYTSWQIKKLKEALDDISIFYYYENVEQIIDSLDLCRDVYGEKGDSVIYCFTQYATRKKIITYDPAKWPLQIESVRPPINIKSHSATIQCVATCISDKFKTLGTWGIIYSTEKHNLSLDNYEGIAYDTDGNFRITLRDLKPNTTYYYKAFYKFNSRDHGDIVFAYGNRKAESYVESWENDFKTLKEEESEDSDEVELNEKDLVGRWNFTHIGDSKETYRIPASWVGYQIFGEDHYYKSYSYMPDEEDEEEDYEPDIETGTWSIDGNNIYVESRTDMIYEKMVMHVAEFSPEKMVLYNRDEEDGEEIYFTFEKVKGEK